MKNKEKLKKILEGISFSKDKDAFMGRFQYNMSLKELKKITEKLDKGDDFEKQIKAISEYVEKIRDELSENKNTLTSELNKKLDVLKSKMAEYRTASFGKLEVLSAEIDSLKEDIRKISNKKLEIPEFENQIKVIESNLLDIILNFESETKDKIEDILSESKKTISNIENDLKKLRKDAMSAIASKGGGNMNRNILVGNNSSTLGRYTDLNVKAGSNITLSYSNNDNLKTTDLTIAATSSVAGGTNRSISTVSVSSTLAAVASTDYVVIAGDGIKLTMPTAVSNTNLYTIKNKAASSVLVAADGAETIDGDANIILATQYVSVDLISDNANWHIT